MILVQKMESAIKLSLHLLAHREKSMKVSLLHTNYGLNSKVRLGSLTLGGRQSKRRTTKFKTVEKANPLLLPDKKRNL